jgi:hypothetical protein
LAGIVVGAAALADAAPINANAAAIAPLASTLRILIFSLDAALMTSRQPIHPVSAKGDIRQA